MTTSALSVLAFLPFLAFFLLLIRFAIDSSVRIASLKAAVAWGMLVTVSTEILSLFHALSGPAVAAFWFLVCAAALALIWRQRTGLAERRRLMSPIAPRLPVAIGSAPIALIVVALGLIAWFAPPNTWDSMTFHMARVTHWSSAGTLEFYPTNVIRQLYEPPWSEYAVLHLQMLSGGDGLANLVQWASMVGSNVGASLVARLLGSSTPGQVLAAILVVTLPMGILQASSTQTDYVLAFWLICSVVFAISFVKGPDLGGAFWTASSLGLAMLTKGTAYIIAAPLVLFLGLWIVSRLRPRSAAGPVAALLVIPILLNAGYFGRNLALFHNPLAPDDERVQLANSAFTPQLVASNVLRDAVLQLGTPNPGMNAWLESSITKVHSRILYVAVSDPRTTWPGTTFHVNPVSLDEDFAGDPLQAILALLAVLGAVGLVIRRHSWPVGLYALGLVMSALLFATYLKWQPWHSRLELPLMVLSAPLGGAVLGRLPRSSIVVGVLGTLLYASAVPWVIDNQTRPLVGFSLPVAINVQPRYLPAGETVFNAPRTDLYFVKWNVLQQPYDLAAKRAAETGCGRIALWSGGNDWEYPLWALMSRPDGTLEIEQVFVTNESSREPGPGGAPCLLVDLTDDQPASVDLSGARFTKTWTAAGVTLYEKSQPVSIRDQPRLWLAESRIPGSDRS
jgi:hypothetical protein